MTPGRFQRAGEIFLSVRNLPAAGRESELSRVCADDAELRSAVDRLLEGDESLRNEGGDADALGISDAVASAAASWLREGGHHGPDADGGAIAGRVIGRYRLVARLGEGGMGTVYQARQDHPDRVVALKVVRPGLVSPGLVRRFQREVQMLGRLHHPGIAQIYDAGTDDRDGCAQPYFVMEFIEGPPLNIFAAQRDPTLSERIELIARIADAVEHAHGRGVIHRDLKPSNILVMGEGKSAQPKVLDFGVARAIDADAGHTMRTEAGQIVGTLAYMSPEQIAGLSDDLDPRCDIYALGVLAYELLAGRPPHDLARTALPEAARIIAERDPLPLGKVSPICRGDIETIIAKAMEKDRERRYRSVAEFAADLRRYLRHEPVLARPATSVYLMRRFARRNRAVVIGAVAVFIALVLGIIGTGISRGHAIDEARRARKMNDYLKGMIEFLDPTETKGKEITLRQMLDEASRRVDQELADEPQVAAELHDTIGRGYITLGANEPAKLHLMQALQMRERIFGPRSLPVAVTLHNLAELWHDADHTDEAIEVTERELAIRSAKQGDNDPETVFTIAALAHLYQRQDRPNLMKPLLERALRAARGVHGRRTLDASAVLEIVAGLLAEEGRFDEAEPLYRKALDIRESLGGGGDARALAVQRDLATLLMNQHRMDEAETLARHALELGRTLYGGLDRQMLLCQNNLIFITRAAGKLEECEALCREALEAHRRLYGDDHEAVASCLNNLGIVLNEQDRFDEAGPIFLESRAISTRVSGPDSPNAVLALGGLCVAMVGQGRFAEAEPILRECLADRSRGLPPDHPTLANIRSLLGESIARQGRYAEAEPMLLESWAIFKARPEAVHPKRFRRALERIAELYEAWGRADQAAASRAELAQLGSGT